MIDADELSKRLGKVKNEEGLFAGEIKVAYVRINPHISASMTPRNYDIEIKINPEWYPSKRAEKWAEKNGVEDYFVSTLEDMIRHESGHWKYCPKNTINHAEIIDAVFDVLEKEGKSEHTERVVNMFEDIIVNRGLKRKHKMVGQVLFWDDQLRHGIESLSYISADYEAFLKLHICGKICSYKDSQYPIRGYFSNENKINEIVSQIAKELGIKHDISPLFDEEKWPELAKKFARGIAPLLSDTPVIYVPSNVFDELIKLPKEKQKIAYKRYVSGKPRPRYMDEFDALDALYTALAQRIPLKATAEGRISFPAIGYDKRPFNIEEDDLAEADITKIMVDNHGNPVPSIAQRHLTIEAPMNVTVKSFPDFTMAALDCSGSMTEGLPTGAGQGSTTYIPWGDNSKYHYAVLGWYGIIKDLENRAILPYIDVGIIGFSDETKAVKSKGSNLKDVKKIILNPEFGRTYLDIKKFEEIVSWKKTSVIMTISDGHIFNWDDIKDKFKRAVDPHIYFHVQIGEPNDVSRNIEEWGKAVFYVSEGKDLEELSRGLVVDVYANYAKRAAGKVELPEVPR